MKTIQLFNKWEIKLYPLQRPFIQYLKKNYDTTQMIGCEIGIDTGINLRNIMRFLKPKKMYAVDIDLSKNRFYSQDIVYIENNSIDAINEIDDILDFVYIDGNHSYENVRKELELYTVICKIVGGHDFRPSCKGVAKAVIEFCEKNNYMYKYGKWFDWWIDLN